MDGRLGAADECLLLTLQDAELAIFDGLDRHHAATLRTVSALDERAREEALGTAFGRRWNVGWCGITRWTIGPGCRSRNRCPPCWCSGPRRPA